MKRMKNGVYAIGLGILMLVWWWHDRAISLDAYHPPSEITARDLMIKGPGDNYYIKLTKFKLAKNGYVVLEREGEKDWIKCFVPIVGAGRTRSKIILKSRRVNNEEELEELSRRGVIEGVLTNGIEKLSGEELRLLQEMYPKTDLTKSWILHHGRVPSSQSSIITLFIGGLGLLGLGFALLFRN